MVAIVFLLAAMPVGTPIPHPAMSSSLVLAVDGPDAGRRLPVVHSPCWYRTRRIATVGTEWLVAQAVAAPCLALAMGPVLHDYTFDFGYNVRWFTSTYVITNPLIGSTCAWGISRLFGEKRP